MADWQAEARRAAQRYGLDPDVFTRQMRQEAHGADLTSPRGAQGPGQFMPDTARSVGLTPVTVHQIGPSYDAAAKLMAGYVKKYGSIRDALVAYNAGPGRVGQSLPAETQHYISVILGHGGDSPSMPLGSPSPAGAVGATAPAPIAPTLDAGQAGDFTSLLSSLLARPQQAPSSTPIAPPTFTAQTTLPQGFHPLTPEAAPAQPAQAGVSQALSLVESLRGTSPTVQSPGGAGASDGPQMPPIAESVKITRSSTGHLWPTAAPGNIIGVPHQGTHTLGNWQSDNAVDIAVPEGTPMVALQSGVVVKVTRHPQGSGRFAGDQITVRGANGNEYFYAHGVASVQPGQKIKRGQSLGVTGSANGVAHLHFGVERGDPRGYLQ